MKKKGRRSYTRKIKGGVPMAAMAAADLANKNPDLVDKGFDMAKMVMVIGLIMFLVFCGFVAWGIYSSFSGYQNFPKDKEDHEDGQVNAYHKKKTRRKSKKK